MDYDLDEFLEEFDDFTQQVRSADFQLFPTRLRQWLNLLRDGDGSVSQHIEWLENREGKTYKFDDVFISESNNAGSAKIDFPDNRLDRLSAYINIFSKFNDGTIDVLGFCHQAFYDRNVNTSIGKMVEGLFDPFASELRRYIKKNFDEPVPDDKAEEINHTDIPASDRIVPINHNVPEFPKITTILASIEEEIRSLNAVDPQVKSAALGELRASKEILNAESVRLDVVQNFLLPCLKWLAIKFAEYGFNGAIGKLMALIKGIFGL